MNKKLIVFLIATHCAVAVAGFVGGIYALPILIAPPAPSMAEVEEIASQAMFTTEFRRDVKGSDRLHWGEGNVSIGQDTITLMGNLSPGPDFYIYLSPEYVETEDDFKRLKSTMVRVGRVNTFNNFVVAMPANTNPSQYTSVVIWCESFEKFITSARYR